MWKVVYEGENSLRFVLFAEKKCQGPLRTFFSYLLLLFTSQMFALNEVNKRNTKKTFSWNEFIFKMRIKEVYESAFFTHLIYKSETNLFARLGYL